jgi:hypothetical protein
VFTAMFENDMQEQRTNNMKIEDFTYIAVEQFLDFLYTGNVQDETNAMELFALAAKYDVPKLKSSSENVVLKNLNKANAFEIFKLAHLYSAPIMKKKAFSKVKTTFTGRELSDNMIDEPERLDQIISAHRTRKRNMKEAQEEFEAAMDVRDKKLKDLSEKLQN